MHFPLTPEFRLCSFALADVSCFQLRRIRSLFDPVPTGPRGSAGGDGGFDDRRGGRGLPRGEVVFPTNPPYSAFLGNLSYDISEGDIENLFRDLKIKSLRLMRDIDNNIKGFGYCDFVDLDSLKGAVALHGETVKGRMIKIDLKKDLAEVVGLAEIVANAATHALAVSTIRLRTGGTMGALFLQLRLHHVAQIGNEALAIDSTTEVETLASNAEGLVAVSAEKIVMNRERVIPFSWLYPLISYILGPWERKKLELQPRSAAAEPAGTNSSNADAPNRPSSPVKNKPNPFGQATARDEGEIMRRLEERRQQKEAERKVAEAAARQAKDEEREKTKTIINKPSAPSKVSDSEGSWRRDGPPRVNPSAPAASRHAKDRDFGRKRTSVPAEGSVAESVGTSGEGVKGRKEKAALSPVAAPVAEAKRGNVYDVLNADEGDDL
ncbi:hypothetical protein HDU84_005652 [Entophlyctis sp. JEL0112]|nr:hypothetical protein HDU84_005652 [Entophlyctis sp. JEL0112]